MTPVSDVKDFIDWVIADEDDEEFNPDLPFGGLRKDAPESAVNSYGAYLKEEKILEDDMIKV